MKDWDRMARRLEVRDTVAGKGQKARMEREEGTCDCCKTPGPVNLTDAGDFCDVCIKKLDW